MVFDLLNINLYHGWVVDPQDQAASLVSRYSYNQLMEKIVSLNSLIVQKEAERKKQDQGTLLIKILLLADH